jgi:Zn-dependent protease
MRDFLKIGRLSKTIIRVHYTWILTVVLVVLALITQFPTELGGLWLMISFGILASLLFFVAITLRELLLSTVAIKKGVDVRSVTLFPIGGLQRVDGRSSMPSIELLLGIVGMLNNLIIAGIFYGVYAVFSSANQPFVEIVLQWLAFLFLTLTLFHIVPGYPLDGGRILRAILWRVLGDYRRATNIASWVGWAFGLLLVAGGITLLVLTPEHFAGVFLITIGLILQNAATHSRRLEKNGLAVPQVADDTVLNRS